MMPESARDPSDAAIFVLSLARRAGRIREVIEQYEALSGGAAQDYQDAVIEVERAALERLGLHADAVDRQMHAFNQAIRLERTRRHRADSLVAGDEAEAGGSAV